MRRREFMMLAGGAALAAGLPAWGAEAADIVIDGVPLPSDVRVADVLASSTDLQRRWSGVWVGAWGGVFRHILLVERISEDGAASVVYAVGDNPYTGGKGRWLRSDATTSGRTLIVTRPTFTATYDMHDDGQLAAVFRHNVNIVRAETTRTDLEALTRPDAVIPWTRGTSEMLQTDLREDGRPIRLEAVIFRPVGQGPFPLAIVNHGSTGKTLNPDLAKRSWVSLDLADFLTRRGWLVAFPQRRGRGKSDGLYDEGIRRIDLGANLGEKPAYTCDADIALAGADRALNDIDAAIASLRGRPDIAPGPVLIGGESRGGVLSVAHAGMHPEQTLGVINFVGGWLGDNCPAAESVNQALVARGGHFGRPMIWLYGRDDTFYSMAHSRKNFAAFENAGGQGKFLEFDMASEQGHQLVRHPDLWAGAVGDYLDALSEKTWNAKGNQRK